MTRPHVSVMMPCYNARESLPWALGSLLAQTFEDWELVLVDDGSIDRPEEIIERASDPRIRVIRLARNQGRGVASQIALEQARGRYLAMLDADDWMYPSRLQREIEVLEQEPDVALVSAGMAILDRTNRLAGVRGTGDGTVRGPHLGLNCPVSHAPSMYRRLVVGNLSFDAKMRLAQDQDFLLRLLHGQRYMVLPDVLYVYAEHGSVSARKAAAAQRFTRRMLRKHLGARPAEAVSGIVQSWVKESIYCGASVLKLDQVLVSKRSRLPTPSEHDAFIEARRTVAHQLASIADD